MTGGPPPLSENEETVIVSSFNNKTWILIINGKRNEEVFSLRENYIPSPNNNTIQRLPHGLNIEVIHAAISELL